MRLTTKGQRTIPQAIREKLGLTPHCEVRFVEDASAAQPLGGFDRWQVPVRADSWYRGKPKSWLGEVTIMMERSVFNINYDG